MFSQVGNAGEIYLEGQSAKHDYTIQSWIDEDQYFNWNNIFGANEIFILGFSAILLFLVAAIIAYWNYLPFWKIVDRYRGFSGKTEIKDFKGIEMMLEELIEDKEHDKKVIQEFLDCQGITCKVDVVCCCKDLKDMHHSVVTYENMSCF